MRAGARASSTVLDNAPVASMDSPFEKLRENLESAAEGISSEQLRWHLPGKWSAAEVLEHLHLTYTGTIKGFERVMTSMTCRATW